MTVVRFVQVMDRFRSRTIQEQSKERINWSRVFSDRWKQDPIKPTYESKTRDESDNALVRQFQRKQNDSARQSLTYGTARQSLAISQPRPIAQVLRERLDRLDTISERSESKVTNPTPIIAKPSPLQQQPLVQQQQQPTVEQQSLRNVPTTQPSDVRAQVNTESMTPIQRAAYMHSASIQEYQNNVLNDPNASDLDILTAVTLNVRKHASWSAEFILNRLKRAKDTPTAVAARAIETVKTMWRWIRARHIAVQVVIALAVAGAGFGLGAGGSWSIFRQLIEMLGLNNVFTAEFLWNLTKNVATFTIAPAVLAETLRKFQNMKLSPNDVWYKAFGYRVQQVFDEYDVSPRAVQTLFAVYQIMNFTHTMAGAYLGVSNLKDKALFEATLGKADKLLYTMYDSWVGHPFLGAGTIVGSTMMFGLMRHWALTKGQQAWSRIKRRVWSTVDPPVVMTRVFQAYDRWIRPTYTTASSASQPNNNPKPDALNPRAGPTGNKPSKMSETVAGMAETAAKMAETAAKHIDVVNRQQEIDQAADDQLVSELDPLVGSDTKQMDEKEAIHTTISDASEIAFPPFFQARQITLGTSVALATVAAGLVHIIAGGNLSVASDLVSSVVESGTAASLKLSSLLTGIPLDNAIFWKSAEYLRIALSIGGSQAVHAFVQTKLDPKDKEYIRTVKQLEQVVKRGKRSESQWEFQLQRLIAFLRRDKLYSYQEMAQMDRRRLQQWAKTNNVRITRDLRKGPKRDMVDYLYAIQIQTTRSWIGSILSVTAPFLIDSLSKAALKHARDAYETWSSTDIDKIRSLITTTECLTLAERTEWLQQLDREQTQDHDVDNWNQSRVIRNLRDDLHQKMRSWIKPLEEKSSELFAQALSRIQSTLDVTNPTVWSLLSSMRAHVDPPKDVWTSDEVQMILDKLADARVLPVALRDEFFWKLTENEAEADRSSILRQFRQALMNMGLKNVTPTSSLTDDSLYRAMGDMTVLSKDQLASVFTYYDSAVHVFPPPEIVQQVGKDVGRYDLLRLKEYIGAATWMDKATRDRWIVLYGRLRPLVESAQAAAESKDVDPHSLNTLLEQLENETTNVYGQLTATMKQIRAMAPIRSDFQRVDQEWSNLIEFARAINGVERRPDDLRTAALHIQAMNRIHSELGVMVSSWKNDLERISRSVSDSTSSLLEQIKSVTTKGTIPALLGQILNAHESTQDNLKSIAEQLRRDVSTLSDDNILKAYLQRELSFHMSDDLTIQARQLAQWKTWLNQAALFTSITTIPTNFYDPNGILQDLTDEWRMKPWLLKRADQYVGALLTTSTAKAAGAFAAGVVGGPAVGVAAAVTNTMSGAFAAGVVGGPAIGESLGATAAVTAKVAGAFAAEAMSGIASTFQDVQSYVNRGTLVAEEYVAERATAKLILAYREAANRFSESKVQFTDAQKQIMLMPWSNLRQLYDATIIARRMSDVQSMVETLTGAEARLSNIMMHTANGINLALDGRSNLVNELGKAGEKLYAYSEAEFAVKEVARDLLLEATLQRWSPSEFAMAVSFKIVGVTDASHAVRDLFKAIRDDVVTPVVDAAVSAAQTVESAGLFKYLLKEDYSDTGGGAGLLKYILKEDWLMFF
jgi:hypothetical protein